MKRNQQRKPSDLQVRATIRTACVAAERVLITAMNSLVGYNEELVLMTERCDDHDMDIPEAMFQLQELLEDVVQLLDDQHSQLIRITF